MTKNDLIRHCIYFKDGMRPESSKGILFDIEKHWVDLILKHSEIIDNTIDEYMRSGLRTFEQFDDTPLSLKAVLFNRYCESNSGSMIECADEFKKWYKDEYKKGLK